MHCTLPTGDHVIGLSGGLALMFVGAITSRGQQGVRVYLHQQMVSSNRCGEEPAGSSSD